MEKQKPLKFYSMKAKKSFTTSDYKIEMKKGRRFAIAMKDGTPCYRILGKEKRKWEKKDEE